MYDDIVFFGMGCAVGVGPEQKAERHDLRRLHSVSGAFCIACETTGGAVVEERQPMGFAIPRD